MRKLIEAKSKQNCKLSTRCTAEDKRVWRYCNSNCYRIKHGFNVVTSHTERRIVSTTVTEVITVMAVETWRRYDFDIMLWHHMDTLSMLHRYRVFTEYSPNFFVLPASHNNDSFFVNFWKESVNDILYLTCERDR